MEVKVTLKRKKDDYFVIGEKYVVKLSDLCQKDVGTLSKNL